MDLQTAAIQEFALAVTDIPFNKLLGLKLDHLSTDHIIMSFDMKPELIGNFLHGILHGGVISSVLDMAGGMAVMASAIHKHPSATVEELANIVGKCSTVDLQVSYVTPGKGTRFIANAFLIKSGNHLSFTRMELTNQDSKLIATASGTYLLR